MKPFLTRLVTLSALGATFLDASATFGQAADPARVGTAQILFEQADADMEKNDYIAACKKLEEVVKLVPEALGAKMKLGECYEAQGKTASAWSQYIIVQAAAPKQQQAERAQQAAARAATLKPKLAMLTLEVPPEVAKTPGLSIARNGVAVGEGQWGTPLPVDAGRHEITASAPGRKPWTKQIDVQGEGAKVTATVQAPAINAGQSENPLAKLLGQRQWPIGVGTTAAGAAGLLLGGMMGGLSMWKRDASNVGLCDSNGFCEPDGISLRNDALLFGNISTAAFIAGGVLAGTGVVLLVMAPSGDPRPPEQAAVVHVLPGGVALAGRF